jgi:hypothetical protein
VNLLQHVLLFTGHLLPCNSMTHLEGDDGKETTSLMSHEALIAEIKRLRERLITLETENASMSVKLSQQQWEVRYCSTKLFSCLNSHLPVYIEVINLILGLPTTEKVTYENGMCCQVIFHLSFWLMIFTKCNGDSLFQVYVLYIREGIIQKSCVS